MDRIENILKAYADGKQDAFKFYGFISPPETDEQYRWAKECGYTHLELFYAPHRDGRMEKALELAEKNGLKIVWLGENFVSQPRPYADHPAFDGIYVDEPLSIGDLEKLSKELDEYLEKYPEKEFYVNFARMNGRSWDVYSGYFKDHFLSKVKTKTVSGDIYPLREPNKNGETMVPFLDYIRRIGKLAVESGSEMYFFVQTMAIHGHNWGHPARRPSWEDIRFLHYVILSCGAQGFQHFCYMSPGGPPYTGEFTQEDYACIHPETLERTEIWYSVQKVIAEFKKFQNIALKFHWKGIMPVYGNQAESPCENFNEIGEYVQAHSYIQSITAQQDLLIGCFEDDDGNVGFTLVNFCDPYLKQQNSVSIEFNFTEPIAVIKDGEVTTVAIENGVYTTVLAPGEGQYLILPKQGEAKLQIVQKEELTPVYLLPPEKVCWKEEFVRGNQVDTYNVYGGGNSHFEFMESGYPEGGSGRVVRLYTSTNREKDWATYKFHLPNIPYDENKKLVFKMYFNASAFSASVSCDHMEKAYPSAEINTLERYGSWTWFDVPLKALQHGDLTALSEVTMCIGNGIPYGTVAYLDEILLCDIEKTKQEENV